MQRCTGSCGRLLLISDFPLRGFGRCWECFNGLEPSGPGLDPISPTPSRRPGRLGGF